MKLTARFFSLTSPKSISKTFDVNMDGQDLIQVAKSKFPHLVKDDELEWHLDVIEVDEKYVDFFNGIDLEKFQPSVMEDFLEVFPEVHRNSFFWIYNQVHCERIKQELRITSDGGNQCHTQ